MRELRNDAPLARSRSVPPVPESLDLERIGAASPQLQGLTAGRSAADPPVGNRRRGRRRAGGRVLEARSAAHGAAGPHRTALYLSNDRDYVKMPRMKKAKLKPFKLGQKVKSRYTGAKGTVVRVGRGRLQPVVKYTYKGKTHQKITRRKNWKII